MSRMAISNLSSEVFSVKRSKQRQTIEVTVSPGGGIALSTVGYVGTECEDATRELEHELGAVQHRKRKPGFYHKAKCQQQQTLGS